MLTVIRGLFFITRAFDSDLGLKFSTPFEEPLSSRFQHELDNDNSFSLSSARWVNDFFFLVFSYHFDTTQTKYETVRNGFPPSAELSIENAQLLNVAAFL